MIRKLKELPILSALLVFAAVFVAGAFATGCGEPASEESGDGSSTVGASDPGTSGLPVADTHDDDDEDDGHDEEGESDVSAEAFGDVAAVWGEVMALKAKLDGVISSKDLVSVHKAAFAIRDHVNLLAGKSHDLSEGKQADLARGVRTVASLAAELDEAGDSGNQKDTEALNEKLQGVLDAIAEIYPEGALK